MERLQRPRLAHTHHSSSCTHSAPSITASETQTCCTPAWNFQSTSWLKKLRGQSAKQSITQTQAVWFLTLSDKVRRSIFTREEVILFRARCQIALLDAPSEIMAQLDQQTRMECMHRSSSQRMRSRNLSTSSLPNTVSSYTAYGSESVIEDMDDEKEDGSDQEDDLDSNDADSFRAGATIEKSDHFTPAVLTMMATGPDDYPETFLRSPTVVSAPAWTRRPSVSSSNSKSFTTINFSRSRQSSISHHARAQPPPPVRIAPVFFYQDPEIKAKLRDCLASPERFDEAIRKGFTTEVASPTASTSTSSSSTSSGSRPQTSSSVPTSSMTQLQGRARGNVLTLSSIYNDDDDSGSEYEDDEEADEDDVSSADEIDGPQTPNWPIAVPRRSSECFPPYDPTTVPSSPQFKAVTNDSAFEEALQNREMTLRMTLTRPELRATDEELYGWQDKVETIVEEKELPDPLALEALVFSDDMTGLKGAFAKSAGRPKKLTALWKTISKK